MRSKLTFPTSSWPERFLLKRERERTERKLLDCKFRSSVVITLLIPQSQQHTGADRHAFLWLILPPLNFSGSAASLFSKRILTTTCWVTTPSLLHTNKPKTIILKFLKFKPENKSTIFHPCHSQCYTRKMKSLNKLIWLTIIPKSLSGKQVVLHYYKLNNHNQYKTKVTNTTSRNQKLTWDTGVWLPGWVIGMLAVFIPGEEAGNWVCCRNWFWPEGWPTPGCCIREGNPIWWKRKQLISHDAYTASKHFTEKNPRPQKHLSYCRNWCLALICRIQHEKPAYSSSQKTEFMMTSLKS